MEYLTESDTKKILQSSPDPKVKLYADDYTIIASLTRVFKESVDWAGSNPRTRAELVLNVTKKATSISNASENFVENEKLKAVNFSLNNFLQSVGMTKLAGLSPARAGVFVSITMAEKVVTAAGFANFDKCKVALASLTTTSGMAGFVCFSTGAFSLGVGCVAGVVAIAADAFDAYGKCNAPKRTQ